MTWSGVPIAKRTYRATQVAIATNSIIFTPSRLKKNGIRSMKKISDICPKVILKAVSVTSPATRVRSAIW